MIKINKRDKTSAGKVEPEEGRLLVLEATAKTYRYLDEEEVQ